MARFFNGDFASNSQGFCRNRPKLSGTKLEIIVLCSYAPEFRCFVEVVKCKRFTGFHYSGVTAAIITE